MPVHRNISDLMAFWRLLFDFLHTGKQDSENKDMPRAFLWLTRYILYAQQQWNMVLPVNLDIMIMNLSKVS